MYISESHMIVQYVPRKEIPARWGSVCSLIQKHLLICSAQLGFAIYASKLAFKPLLEVWFLSFEKTQILKKQVTDHLEGIILPENMGFMFCICHVYHSLKWEACHQGVIFVCCPEEKTLPLGVGFSHLNRDFQYPCGHCSIPWASRGPAL